VLIEELKQSPEARRLLPPEIWGMVTGAAPSEQSNVKGKDAAHEGSTISQSEQKNWLTIWIADAHRSDRKRFVVRGDEKLTAFVELERAIRACGK
jgi:hypothetical protein